MKAQLVHLQKKQLGNEWLVQVAKGGGVDYCLSWNTLRIEE